MDIEHSFLFFKSPVRVEGTTDIAMIICSSGTTGFSKGKQLAMHVSFNDAILNSHFLIQ